MNKLLFYTLTLSTLFILFYSCKDDENNGGTNGGTRELVINEFVAKGSIQTNEFGDSTDWIEIYNPSSDPFTLTAGQWSLADADEEYILPQTYTIPANGFLIFWCDGLDTIATQIHTSFKLTAQGDEVTLSKIEGGDKTTVDSRYYFNANAGQSYGLYPDGSEAWDERTAPTPGSSNVD